ncbi:hypothetical protein [Bradyrhizobium sp. USDA 4504]
MSQQAKTTDTTSRRRFLAGAAVAALVPTTAAAMAVDADPIFALIEAHRAAEKAYSDATAEQSRREQQLYDEGIGVRPYVTILWMSRPMICHSHQQIDNFVGLSDQARQKAHADLDAVLKRHSDVLGDAESATDAAGDAASEAFDELLATPPATMHGLRALISYLVEEFDDVEFHFRGDSRLETLLFTIQDALAVRGQA